MRQQGIYSKALCGRMRPCDTHFIVSWHLHKTIEKAKLSVLRNSINKKSPPDGSIFYFIIKTQYFW